MYHTHFGLRANPFQAAPSADFFFASRGHREALAALQWGLSDPTGLVLLTGDVGTGKTTVIRELFSREKGEVRAALISNPRLDFDSLLESVLRQVGVDPPQGRLQLHDALICATQSHRVVVVIDEAQQLSDEALEEFRLLSNFDPAHLQLMLVGQPELLERLSSPRLRQLNQRIAIRAILNPLDPTETIAYLGHRIRAAGGEAQRIFSRPALRAIVRVSMGIPRRVNVVSHNALLSAYSSGARRVYRRHVIAAEQEYDHSNLPRTANTTARSLVLGSLPAALLVIAAAGFGLFHHGAASRAVDHGVPPVASGIPVENPSRLNIRSNAFARADEATDSVRAAAPSASPAAVPPVMPAAKSEANTSSVESPLVVEAAASGVEAHADEKLGSSPQEPAASASEVVVQAGDTLSSIAQRYSESATKLDVRQLIAVNPEIKNANLIYPGEKVRLIPAKEDHE